MNRVMKAAAKTVVPVLVALLVAPPVWAERIRCKSEDYRYKYCRVPTRGRVELVRQISRTDCRYGRTWGYDHGGVWVDRGCAAEFEVGDGYRRGGRDHGSSSRDRRDDRHRHDDDKSSGKDAAVAAAVVGGVALLATIMGSQSQQRQAPREALPPNWLVGTFRGYNPMFNADVEMTVSPEGSVTSRTPRGTIYGRFTPQGLLDLGGTQFNIQRSGNGLLLSQAGNPSNQMMYHRVR